MASPPDDLRQLDVRPVSRGASPPVPGSGMGRDGGFGPAHLPGPDQAQFADAAVSAGGAVPGHIWPGVSVEDAAHTVMRTA